MSASCKAHCYDVRMSNEIFEDLAHAVLELADRRRVLTI